MDFPPPKTLCREARGWWTRLQSEYGIEDEGGLLILQAALEAFSRLREIQKILAADGLIMTDKNGQKKLHPLVSSERDTRAAFLAGLKQLNLDVEPLRDGPGRPGNLQKR